MRKILIIIFITLSCLSKKTTAQQAHFVFSGVVEFDKTINMHARIKEMVKEGGSTLQQQAYEQYINTQSKFDISKSSLKFSAESTLFTLKNSSISSNAAFFGFDPLAQQLNTVYNNLKTKKSIIQKTIYDENFLVNDTLARITWKFVDETREIAGYECRRANGLFLDSIYIVAFFSEKIRVAGGPERFSGLPGMILGLVIPREHITWFATSVVENTSYNQRINPPNKGKSVNRKELESTLLRKLGNANDRKKQILINNILF